VNLFYVTIWATESYEFDKIRTAGVTWNATTYKNSQGDNPICSTRDEISQPPGHFNHEPPLQSCTLISNHGFVRAFWRYRIQRILLFHSQVCSQSPQMRAVGTRAGLPNLFSVANHFDMRKFIARHKRFCDVTISYCDIQIAWFWYVLCDNTRW